MPEMENKPLAQILTATVVSFLPETPLLTVLETMERQRISCVVAADDRRMPVGVLTERDVLKLYAQDADVSSLRLAEAMSFPVISQPADIDYREAYHVMAENRVRHLTVVDETGALVGIVTEGDFLAHLGAEYLVDEKRVAAAMDRHVVCLGESQPLTDALKLMFERHSDYVIVTTDDGREPRGILTERDIVRLARSAVARNTPVGRLITSGVHAISPDAPLQQATLRMQQLGVRRLLVTHETAGVVGVVTRHDIVKALQGGYVEYLRHTLLRLKNEVDSPDLPLMTFHRHLLLGGVLDLVGDGIYMVGMDGRFLDANERGCAVLGYSHAELRHMKLWEVASGVDGPAAWAQFGNNLPPDGLTIDNEHCRKDGSSFPVRVRIFPSRVADQPVLIGIATDRSAELALEATIRERERFYHHVIDSAIDGFFRIDAQRQFVDVNDRFCELFGYAREEILQKTPIDLVTGDCRAELMAQMQRIETTEHRRYQLNVLRKDGSTVPVLLNNTTHRNLHGEIDGAFGFVTDLTPVLAAQKAVAESERELRAILDNMQDTYYRVDLDGRLLRVSASVRHLLGWSETEVVGRLITDFYCNPAERELFLASLQQNGGSVTAFETRMRHADGREVWVTTNAHYVRDEQGQIIGIEGTTRDVSDRKHAEARIDFLAHHDPLTELPNRLLFKDRCERAVAHSLRSGLRTAMLFVDLDRFKAVNDSYGHPAGDALLCEAAKRLSSCVRDTDTVSRQGGDEFLIVLTDIRDNEAIAQVAQKILGVLELPFLLDGRYEATISASIGVAVCPEDGKDFETLLRKADSAMYHAKDSGRNAFSFFDARMNVDSHEHLEVRQRIHRGIERGEFELHYQPLVDLASGRIVGAEALLRWVCPERGMIAPAHFIPIAEESGLIVPLGEWVLHEACRELRRWHEGGRGELGMAVNLSAIQFRRGGLEDSLQIALDATGVPATALELELTESILLHEADQALAAIQRLKGMGVRLSIDDFGTGYSSLAYLKRLAVDKLKIDQSFVRDMAHDPDNAAIVRAVIQMAKSLNLKVLAEGVETALVADHLRHLGCDLVQGYHFGHPIPATEFRTLIGI